MTDAAEPEKQEQERRTRAREEEIRRIPPQEIDPSKWPRGVRTIGLGEMNGLGVDRDGRLHWNGKPVEIIGQRLDLTWPQFWVAVLVAFFTFVAAAATAAQAWFAYHDWVCKVGNSAYAACPPTPPNSGSGPS